jgi:hypothetical protein
MPARCKAALFAMAVAMGPGHAAGAEGGHCMVMPGNICATGKVTDADGVLLPGFHIYFNNLTDRYDHAILGDGLEWGTLMYLRQGSPHHGPYMYHEYTLPVTRVFEDVELRFADLDGHGEGEIIVVETDVDRGAQLAVYGYDAMTDTFGKRAATDFIGETHRWLAPAGIGDFDGDGRVEIAYVERPHRAHELVFVRLQGDQLVEIARAPGFSNHRIGDSTIAGGVRRCPDGNQVILASADWTRAMSARLQGDVIEVVDLGPIAGPADLQGYMGCGG